jgi:hypothetical protein
MKDRYLNQVLGAAAMLTFSIAAMASGASPYAHQLVGQCFHSQLDAMKPFQLPDGSTDENIVATENKSLRDSTWIVDKTSGHNFQWYLLERTERGFCYTLYVPFAADVTSVREKGVLTIKAKTQPSPGADGYQMTFRKSSKASRFVPYKCSETHYLKGSSLSTTRTIDCLSVAQ